MGTKHKVLVIDDHPMFRDGVTSIVRSSQLYDVVGETGTCSDGLSLARGHQPDLAIVDISLPDGNGIDLVKSILTYAPECRVLVLSMHSRIDFIVTAFQAGASAFLAKDSSRDQLLHAMDAVMSGKQYLDGSLSPRIMSELLSRTGNEPRMADASYNSLTRREQQILRMLAEGMSPASIAERLFISRKTVENHRTNLLSKLNITNPVELVRYAARMGLIDLDTLG